MKSIDGCGACLENWLCTKSSALTGLFLLWFHPFSCYGFINTFALKVVSCVVGQGVVCEFYWLIEEMGLEFQLFLPRVRPCVSPRNVESTKTSHNCMSIGKSEKVGLRWTFICSWVVRTGPAHTISK